MSAQKFSSRFVFALPSRPHIIAENINTIELERFMMKFRKLSKDAIAYDLMESGEFSFAPWIVGQIRHFRVHRNSITMPWVINAVMLPAILKDDQQYAEVKRMFMLLMDGTPDFDEALLPLPECVHTREVLGRVQSLLEIACFKRVSREHLSLLWQDELAEMREVPHWKDKIRRARLSSDGIPEYGEPPLDYTLGSLQVLRIDAAHQIHVQLPMFLKMVHTSFQLLILLGRRTEAIEVEALAEAWLSKSGRSEVLGRLRACFLVHSTFPSPPHERRRECRRRLAIAEVLQSTDFKLSEQELNILAGYACEDAQLKKGEESGNVRVVEVLDSEDTRVEAFSPFPVWSTAELSTEDLKTQKRINARDESHNSDSCSSSEAQIPIPRASDNDTCSDEVLSLNSTISDRQTKVQKPLLESSTVIAVSCVYSEIGRRSDSSPPGPEIHHPLYNGEPEPLTFSLSMHECLKGEWSEYLDTSSWRRWHGVEQEKNIMCPVGQSLRDLAMFCGQATGSAIFLMRYLSYCKSVC